MKKTGLDEFINMMVRWHILVKDDTEILSSGFNVRVKSANKLSSSSDNFYISGLLEEITGVHQI